MLCGALLSCNKDEDRETPEPPIEMTGGDVLFSVPAPDIAASSVRAVLFDSEGLYYDALTPDDTAGRLRVKVPAGDYRMWVVAEADMDAGLESLEQGVSTEADFTALAVDRQITDDASVPMVSSGAVAFTCDADNGADLGTVELGRMAARIDIVNAVTDFTVDKVVLKNAVIAGSITGEAMPSGDIFEDAACEEELSGDSESPAVLSLYTYDNLLTDDAHLTAVEITYTFAGEQSVKEFTLMEGEQPAALVRGTLYSIQLVEDGAELDYSVEGWTSGASAMEYFSLQEALNSKLAINYFAATNAHSFDFENMTVSLCKTNNSTVADSEDASWFGFWNETFAGEFTGDDGQKYRLPTLDEMLLIGTKQMFTIRPGGYSKDVLDMSEPLGDVFGIPFSGGNGTSDYRSTTEGNQCCYAIRFKNTLQQAAYRYEMVTDDVENAYMSVKVKAIGFEMPTIDEVSDEAYWVDGYLEFDFPLCGQSSGQNRGQLGYYWTATYDQTYPDVTDKMYYLAINSGDVRMNSNKKTNAKYNVRLVKVN